VTLGAGCPPEIPRIQQTLSSRSAVNPIAAASAVGGLERLNHLSPAGDFHSSADAPAIDQIAQSVRDVVRIDVFARPGPVTLGDPGFELAAHHGVLNG
jgi:hypothetical protein